MGPILPVGNMPIGNLPVTRTEASPPSVNSTPAGDESKGLFAQFLQSTNQDQLNSNQAIQDLVTGKTDNIQQVVMSVAQAEMSFQLFMEVRNNLINSYNELMRMQF